MPATDPFVTPLETAATLIQEADYFAGRPGIVFTEIVGDITNTVTRAIGKLGLAISVLVPDAGNGRDIGEGLQQTLRIVVEVAELVTINKTLPGDYKPALAAVREVIKAIHQKPNGLDPVGQPHRRGLNEITVDLDNPFQRRPSKQFLIYHVYATTTVRY